MATSSEYREFLEKIKEISTLEQVGSILDWDQQTYMPPGAFAMRGQQGSAIAGIIHERLTSDRMGKLIRTLKKQELSPDGAAHPSRDGAQVEESVERPRPAGQGDLDHRLDGLRSMGQSPEEQQL